MTQGDEQMVKTVTRARPQRRSLRTVAVAAAIACLSTAAGVVGGTMPAAAEPVSSFYHPPAQFDTTPGAVIKQEPLPVFATAPGADGSWPVAGTRVLYTSRTQDGTPVAVSGTYLDATHPWEGPGERPTVVVAPGTAGQGDQCAMSVAFSTGLYADPAKLSMSANQEAIAAAAWTAAGARVIVTDHIGLGTPGIHTYVNRVEAAHGVLDAARAAGNLSGDPNAPLVFWGYSQGGGATAAAAELQPSYAPELNLKGTWAGGPTADLMQVLGQVDGALIGGVIGYAINGFVDRDPELGKYVDTIVTPQGKALLAELGESCIGDVIFKHPFLRTNTMTVDGRPLLDHMQEIPTAVAVLDEQRIGHLTPTSPVLITSGRHDDTVPYGQAGQLATDWCERGAAVTFRTNELPPILPGMTLPNHFGPLLIDGYGTDSAIAWLFDRLAGKPAGGCAVN